MPPRATAGSAISVSAKVRDPDGDHVTVSWNFGDGATASGTDVSHTFAGTGTDQVTLAVRDETGLVAARTFTVTVSSAPKTAPGDRTPPSVSAHLVPARVGRDSIRKVRLALKLSESSTVSVSVVRRDRAGRGRAVQLRRSLSAGSQRLSLTRLLRLAHATSPGRYRVTVSAVDRAGNRSRPLALTLTVTGRTHR